MKLNTKKTRENKHTCDSPFKYKLYTQECKYKQELRQCNATKQAKLISAMNSQDGKFSYCKSFELNGLTPK